jgi:hypothetical protein
MNWKLFLLGVGFLTAAYLMYKWIKRKKPASEKTNGDSLVSAVFIQYWGALTMCAIVGIVFIIESFV